MDVAAAMHARKSVRGFLDKPVPRELIERIFTDAQRAPSWCNIQPWRVWVTAGDVHRQFTERMTAAAKAGMMTPDFPWPGVYPEPYNTHRKDCGKALYSAMGIARDDGEGRQRAWMANYAAFGAPHAAVVAMDRRWAVYAAIDVGCWLQSVLLLCVEAGLATCPQAALATYPQVAREVLGIPADFGVLFGIAIGYEDGAAPANTCRTTRSPLAENVKFLGF
jgi:nitroreductase